MLLRRGLVDSQRVVILGKSSGEAAEGNLSLPSALVYKWFSLPLNGIGVGIGGQHSLGKLWAMSCRHCFSHSSSSLTANSFICIYRLFLILRASRPVFPFASHSLSSSCMMVIMFLPRTTPISESPCIASIANFPNFAITRLTGGRATESCIRVSCLSVFVCVHITRLGPDFV